MIRKLISYVFAGIIGLIAYVLVISRPASLPLADKVSPDHLRIAVANIHYANANITELTDSLIQTDSDILVILEWQGRNLALDSFRERGYSVSLNHPQSGTHGVCIISKKGLKIQAQLVDSPIKGPCRMPIATARFQYNSRQVALLGVHVPPPIDSCQDTTLPTIKAIHRRVVEGKLAAPFGAGKSGDDVIAAGDFNLYSFHKEIGEFTASGLIDTYAAANFAYGPTWSPLYWLPSLIRIDYIFTSQQTEVISSNTIKLSGSDHRGIVSDLRI